jgi:hypothetical protein
MLESLNARAVSEFPVLLMKSVMPPRKRQHITTILPMPPPPYDMLDRMLKLIMRLFRRDNDIFHMIWGDVLSARFNKERVLRNNLMMYVPRSLLQLYETEPELALIPALQTWPTN